MTNYFPPLLPEQVYHLQSWAIGDEKLFREEENYRFFLERFIRYALPVAELYSYSLVPDHFDLLVRIRSNDAIEQHFNILKPDFPFDKTKASAFIMKCFSNMLNSYAKSFNKVYERRGSVFIDYIRRLEIICNDDLCNSVIRIHKSPVHLGYCRRLQEWKWSSFRNYFYEYPHIISREKVLESFGGRHEFLSSHKRSKKLQVINF
jgi:hypothetical protein